jgi:D-beta-D-heptose 7-phosphate kinase/D-beta-D-heptose 1-phosphate adenosyltransferase
VSGLVDLLDRFGDLSVVVVGDAMLDVYLEGPAQRLCREAPVPVVELDRRADQAGGAANTAVNVSQMGADVRLLSVLGRDDVGERLHACLESSGVRTDCLVRHGARRTLSLNRVVAGAHILVRFDDGDRRPVGGEMEELLVASLESALDGADAVIISDYGYGVITPRLLEVLREHAARSSPVLVVDSKHPAAFRHLAPTAVKPNWSEAVQLVGAGELDGLSERADGIAEHGERILELTGAQIAAVTLDSEGAIVLERGRPPHRT